MIHQITDNLWITDLASVENKSTDNFDIVIGVCQTSAEPHVSCEYNHFNMSDGPNDRRDERNDKENGRHDYEFFSEAAETVLEAIQADKNVLVHCHAGRSRSASVCIAALGVQKELPYMDAISLVTDARHVLPERTLADHAKRFIEEHTNIDHTPFSGK